MPPNQLYRRSQAGLALEDAIDEMFRSDRASSLPAPIPGSAAAAALDDALPLEVLKPRVFRAFDQAAGAIFSEALRDQSRRKISGRLDGVVRAYAWGCRCWGGDAC